MSFGIYGTINIYKKKHLKTSQHILFNNLVR